MHTIYTIRVRRKLETTGPRKRFLCPPLFSEKAADKNKEVKSNGHLFVADQLFA